MVAYHTFTYIYGIAWDMWTFYFSLITYDIKLKDSFYDVITQAWEEEKP